MIQSAKREENRRHKNSPKYDLSNESNATKGTSNVVVIVGEYWAKIKGVCSKITMNASTIQVEAIASFKKSQICRESNLTG